MEEGKASKERRGNAGEVGAGVVSYGLIRRADSIEKGDHLVRYVSNHCGTPETNIIMYANCH